MREEVRLLQCSSVTNELWDMSKFTGMKIHAVVKGKLTLSSTFFYLDHAVSN